jgi:hypothetical protein
MAQAENILLSLSPEAYATHAKKLRKALWQLGQQEITLKTTSAFLQDRPKFKTLLEAYLNKSDQALLLNVEVD